MLTKKQHELLMFIHERIRETGVSPSFDEMKEALDLASKSGIHRLITALEERGFIRRLANRARALEVLRQPEDVGTKAPPRAANGNSAAAVVRPPEVMPAPANDVIEIPLHGRIAAGVPIEALETSATLPVPAALLGAGEHYALEVSGDSMIEAGINDGDYVVVKEQPVANNGDIVVAIIEDGATVKRFYKEKGHIRLQPENSSMDPIITRDCSIAGKVVAVFRRI